MTLESQNDEILNKYSMGISNISNKIDATSFPLPLPSPPIPPRLITPSINEYISGKMSIANKRMSDTDLSLSVLKLNQNNQNNLNIQSNSKYQSNDSFRGSFSPYSNFTSRPTSSCSRNTGDGIDINSGSHSGSNDNNNNHDNIQRENNSIQSESNENNHNTNGMNNNNNSNDNNNNAVANNANHNGSNSNITNNPNNSDMITCTTPFEDIQEILRRWEVEKQRREQMEKTNIKMSKELRSMRDKLKTYTPSQVI